MEWLAEEIGWNREADAEKKGDGITKKNELSEFISHNLPLDGAKALFPSRKIHYGDEHEHITQQWDTSTPQHPDPQK